MKNLILSSVFVCALLWNINAYACSSKVTIHLENNNGGVFVAAKVSLLSKSGKDSFQQISNKNGDVEFELPCNQIFVVHISNYTRYAELKSPAGEGSISHQTFTYSSDMAAKDKAFAMNELEKTALDNTANSIADTFSLNDIRTLLRLHPEYFMKVLLKLTDLNNRPLANETVIFTGVKRNKSYKGVTNVSGIMVLYLIKGDNYMLNFKHHKDFALEDCPYSKGISESDMSFSYIGTVEHERRLREEAKRIAAEELRLKKEMDEFKSWCKKLKISEEEGYKRKLKSEIVYTPDTVIEAVFARNKWTEKLIVCDLTGSMLPYTSQLSLWYQLNYKKEKNLQFVFFNDGDNLPNDKKVIGKTGGIYYTQSKGLDSLRNFIAMVSSRGGGGDCPENNMEALIKGVQMAGPYKELVMIVDNYAPVKDIILLKSFTKPVHIVLCGADSSPILCDYLDIARKTGGSIHTIEEDIVNLAALSEGEDVVIGGKTYRIMVGKFILLLKA